MITRTLLKDIALFGGLIMILFFIVFRKSDPPVYQVSPIKEVERRIEGKETQIQTFNTRIVSDKKIVSDIQDQLVDLRSELMSFKQLRDTVQIVQIQDTLITALSDENRFLYSIIDNQDSIIIAQRYIINSKDTLISVSKHDLRKVKRQRNISLLLNAIQTGIIIFK